MSLQGRENMEVLHLMTCLKEHNRGLELRCARFLSLCKAQRFLYVCAAQLLFCKLTHLSLLGVCWENTKRFV